MGEPSGRHIDRFLDRHLDELRQVKGVWITNVVALVADFGHSQRARITISCDESRWQQWSSKGKMKESK